MSQNFDPRSQNTPTIKKSRNLTYSETNPKIPILTIPRKPQKHCLADQPPDLSHHKIRRTQFHAEETTLKSIPERQKKKARFLRRVVRGAIGLENLSTRQSRRNERASPKRRLSPYTICALRRVRGIVTCRVYRRAPSPLARGMAGVKIACNF